MGWWPENYPWVVGIVGGMLVSGIVGWALRRLFRGSRKWPQQRQEADLDSEQIQLDEPEDGVVTRRRTGTFGAILRTLSLAALAGGLVVAGLLYAIALLQHVPISKLSESLVIAVAGTVVALWILIAGLYLLARRMMRRRAKQLGIKVGLRVSNYWQSLVLPIDLAEALARCRAALLSLPQAAELAGDSAAPDEVVGRTGRSERSFGEIIRIRVQQTGLRRVTIEIRSRPATWQLFGGGINAENVAGILRYLEARAARVEKREAVAAEAPARGKTLQTSMEGLAIAHLAVLVGYTGLLIVLKDYWPDRFATLAGWLDAVPLDPLRLLGQDCPAGVTAPRHPLFSPLNALILPTLLIYSAYNAVDFHQKRERMDTVNWILCIGSLVFLPILFFMGCSSDWGEGLPQRYRGLVHFMLEETAGGAVYALMLVVFTNGISYLPALVLARIFRRDSNSSHRRR